MRTILRLTRRTSSQRSWRRRWSVACRRPRLRPADKIDITEEQLVVIKNIFDSVPRASGGRDSVQTLTMFMTFRKDPRVRALNTAIARDPAGFSRVPTETFQQVFDRMERELQVK